MSVDFRTLQSGDADYPARLVDLSDPPEELHVLGTIPEGPAVSIVGSRAADRGGITFASRLAFDLAEQGVTIVSGGARGIDQAAHSGALDAGGRTVIVLGCGLDVDYPKGSGPLRVRAASAGAVVTELDDGTPPLPGHFPRRNRIVAALADAVIVVQAGARSGALSTARRAQDIGRPVLAVPGTPGAALTRGTHGLIKRGALLTEGPEDVLAAMGRNLFPQRRLITHPEAPVPCLSGLPAAVHESLLGVPASADELARSVDQPVGDVLAALVDLELRGLVRSQGGCYERT